MPLSVTILPYLVCWKEHCNYASVADNCSQTRTNISQKGLLMAQKLKNYNAAGLSLTLLVGGMFQFASLTTTIAQEATPQTWFKICAKQADNDVCNVQYRVVASNGQIITSVNLFTVKGKINRRIFQVTVPTNRMIPPGVAVKIDKRKENRMPYASCFRDRCMAEVKMDNKLITQLKSGKELLLTSVNFQSKSSPIKIPLKGFTAAYDGPPLKKSDVDEQNQQLQKQLEEKAKKAREALEEAQKKATQ
ncbi:MAG: invasion associated locus B family protein [Rhizobiaceae bacterium]|nr:invasion associated locus B family protein [Rhizobiaceae bacterium]